MKRTINLKFKVTDRDLIEKLIDKMISEGNDKCLMSLDDLKREGLITDEEYTQLIPAVRKPDLKVLSLKSILPSND